VPKPLFFGDGARRLYGVYYASSSAAGGPAVLVCPPIGHEYVRSCFAIRKLCERLAGNGFSVLRFDYSGLGNSSGGGDGDEADVKLWRSDIRTAAVELSGLSGQKDLTLVGLRLGAALAVGLQPEGVSIKNLVMWDPVIDGADFLTDLRRLHELCLRDTRKYRRPQPARTSDAELVGFRFPATLRESIKSLRLGGRSYPYENCFLVTSSERPEYAEFSNSVQRNTRGRFTRQTVADPTEWDDYSHVEFALIATRGVAAIADKIANGFV